MAIAELSRFPRPSIMSRMSLTVREALTLQVLKTAEVVAGHRGLDNPIRWTHIIDMPDVAEWVKGGEVLITSGLGIHDSPQAQSKYLREAAEKRVAAVLVSKDYLPQTPLHMRQLADEYGLPLIELPRETPFVDVTEAILRRLAVKSSVAEKEYLLEALLAGNLPDDEETLTRLSAIGLEAKQAYVILLAQPADGLFNQQLSDEQMRNLISRFNHTAKRGVFFSKPNFVIGIFAVGVRADSEQPFVRSLATNFEQSPASGLRVGVGRLAKRVTDFPASYREARAALYVTSLMADTRTIYSYDDLGVWTLLLRLKDDVELQRFTEQYLQALIHHDREQQTSWLVTLETFLRHNGNLRATARALGLHRNTVTYQIENISRVLGCDINRADIRLNLQIALLARRLLADQE